MAQAGHEHMTVIQLLPALNGGGVERGVVEVVGALVQQGHRAIVVSSGGRLVKQIETLGGEHVCMPIHKKSPVTLRTVQPLRRLIRETRAQVLHARSRIPAWAGHLAWRSTPTTARPAWVTSVHGLNSVSRYSKIMTSGQMVEVVSNTVRDYVLKNYPDIDPGKLVLNHRGVDPDEYAYGYRPDDAWLDQWYRDYPQLDGKFVVTLAGRISRLKGHHDLIDAVAKLCNRGIAAHGLIAGGEDPRRAAYFKELRQTVATKGLSDHVTFTGHRSDIRDILAVSGAVVSLSRKPESFGRTLLEAVRLGRPVVGYDHGGVGEVLAEVYPQGRTPPGDTSALAERLACMAMGKTRPPAPTDAFPLNDMLERTLHLYRDVANAPQ
ncbi:MAG: glycosyltransferase [Phycisphaeraceae bacterium]|nr:glycosyltransferase [Phycisphaeraceae bacterium]